MKINPKGSFSLYGAQDVQQTKEKPIAEIKKVDKSALDMMDSIGRAQVAFRGKADDSEFLSFEDKIKMLKERGVNRIDIIGEFLALPEEAFKERIKYAFEDISAYEISKVFDMPKEERKKIDNLISYGLNVREALRLYNNEENEDFINFMSNNSDIDKKTLIAIYFKCRDKDKYLSAIRSGLEPVKDGRIMYEIDDDTVLENIPRISKMGLSARAAASVSNIKDYMLNDVEKAYKEKEFDIAPSILYAKELNNNIHANDVWKNGFYITRRGYSLHNKSNELRMMPQENLDMLKKLADIGLSDYEFSVIDGSKIQNVENLKNKGFSTKDAYYLSSLEGDKFEKCAKFVKKGIPAQVGRNILFLSDEEADKVASYIKEGYEPEFAAGLVRYRLNDEEKEKAIKYREQYENPCAIAKDKKASEIADFYLKNDMLEENKNFYSIYKRDEEGYQKRIELQKRGFKNQDICCLLDSELNDKEIEKAIFYIKSGVSLWDAIRLVKENIPEGSEEAVIKLGLSDVINCVDWFLNKRKEVDFPLDEAALYVEKQMHFEDAVNLSMCKIDPKAKEYMIFCNKYCQYFKVNIDELEQCQELNFYDSEDKINTAKEFVKRGISPEDSILFAQLEYGNSDEIYRSAELYKLGFELLDAYDIAKDKDEYELIKKENKQPTNNYMTSSSRKTKRIIQIKSSMDCSLEDAKNIYNNYDEYAQKFSASDYDFNEIIRYTKEKDVNIMYSGAFKLNEEAKERFEKFLSEGVDSKEAMVMAYSNIDMSDEDKVCLMKKLLSKDFASDINKKVQNPNIKKWADKIFDFENLPPETAKKLLESGLTYEEIVDLASDFSKKSLKLAMKKPNQYLSNIPLKLTTKVNGKLPVLEGDDLEKYQNKFAIFCENNLAEIIKAQKYLDSDTFNQLMDKRDAHFEKYLKEFDDVKKENSELLSKLIKLKTKENKPLTAKEKIELSKIVMHSQFAEVSLQDLSELEYIDIKELKQNLIKKSFLAMGFSECEFNSIPKDKLNFDEDYVHLLLQSENSGMCRDIYNEYIKPSFESEVLKKKTISSFENMLENEEDLIHEGIDPESLKEILEYIKNSKTLNKDEVYPMIKNLLNRKTLDNAVNIKAVIRAATLHEFREYIQDGNNNIGKANKETKKQFEENKLNYDVWFNKDENLDIDFELNNKDFKITMWDRCPQKDLFLGNKTSCCTGLGEANGASTPIYLSNSAFNVVELKDDRGNTVAMSRIYMANVDNKPSLIMENIEVNNEFLKHLNVSKQREMVNKFVQYMKNFSKKVTQDDNTKIYFSTSYSKLNTDNLEKEDKKVDFIGNVSSDNFYSNTLKGWVSTDEFKDAEASFYKV